MHPIADDLTAPRTGGATPGAASIRVLLLEDASADAALVARLLWRCAEGRFHVMRAPTLSAARPIVQPHDAGDVERTA